MAQQIMKTQDTSSEKMTILVASLFVPYISASTGSQMTLTELLELRKAAKTGDTVAIEALGGVKAMLPVTLLPYTKNIESFTLERCVDALHKYDIRSLDRDHLINLPQEVVTKLSLREGTALVPAWDSKNMLFVPSEKLPKFTPHYFLTKPDLSIISNLRKITLAGDLNDQRLKILDDLVQYHNTHYYGNGEVAGQVNRLRLCQDVRDKVGASDADEPEDPDFKVAALLPFLELNKVPSKEGPFLLDSFSDTIEAYDKLFGLTDLSPSRHSDAGIIWGEGIKRGDIPDLEFSMANHVYEAVKKHGPTKLSGNAPWLRLTKIKPKDDTYVRGELKTRNIIVYNSFMQLLFQVPVRYPMLHRYDHVPGSGLSLMGWNCFNGTKLILDRIHKEEFGQLVYADNVYLWWHEGTKVFWASLDGEKAESTNTRRDVRDFMKCILWFWSHTGDVIDTARVPTAWRDLLWNVFPWCSVDSIGLLGNQQLPIPGLGSGSVATMYINQIKSAKFLIKWLKSEGPNLQLVREGQGWIFSKGAIEAMRVVHCNFRIECCSEIVLGAPLLRMDLLGYDFKLNPLAEVKIEYVPVLAYDRMLNALLFQKQDYLDYVSKGRRAEIGRALSFVRYRAIYLIGGWTYEPLAISIRLLCSTLQKTVSNLHDLSDREISEVLSISGVEASQVAQLIRLPEVPSLIDVAKLFGIEESLVVKATPIMSKKIVEKQAFSLMKIFPKDWAAEVLGDEDPINIVIQPPKGSTHDMERYIRLPEPAGKSVTEVNIPAAPTREAVSNISPHEGSKLTPQKLDKKTIKAIRATIIAVSKMISKADHVGPFEFSTRSTDYYNTTSNIFASPDEAKKKWARLYISVLADGMQKRVVNVKEVYAALLLQNSILLPKSSMGVIVEVDGKTEDENLILNWVADEWARKKPPIVDL